MSPENRRERRAPPGQNLAVAAEALFLANLLIAPGLAFLLLLRLWWRHPEAPPLARLHLRQTVAVSLWGGLLLVAVSLACLGLGGFAQAASWVLVILYVTCVHATLVVCGILGLARAMAGQPFRYPLLGPRGSPDEA